MNLTTTQLAQIKHICLVHNVTELHLIGSVLRTDFRPDSDVDLLIKFGEIQNGGYINNLMGLKEDLEAFLERKVDIVVNQEFRNPAFRKQIRKTKQLVFGQTTEREINTTLLIEKQ